MKTRYFLFFLPLIFLLSSCGETFSDVVTRNQDGFDELKADMAAAVKLIPQKAVNMDLLKPLDPVPKFVKGKLTESNTLITVLEQLKDPNVEIDREKGLDLYLNDVKNLYIWAGQEGKAFDDYEQKLHAAFKLRYFVVYQTLEFKAPSMVDAKTYDRGGVVLFVQIYDREAGKVICAFPVTAQAAEKVSFTYKKDSSEMTAGLRHARSTMWQAAGDSMFELLEKKTGGSFKHK